MKKLVSVLLLLVLTVLLTACFAPSNTMRTWCLYTEARDGALYMELLRGQIYKVDLANGTALQDRTLSSEDFVWDTAGGLECIPSFKKGSYYWTVPAGYEGIKPHIEGCAPGTDNSAVSACGYVKGQLLQGFVQVYDGLKEHGTCEVEQIVHSLLFSYDPDTDAFTVIEQLDGAIVVGFGGEYAVYWRDKAYYSYHLPTGDETYLVEDKAYDSGLRDLSSTAAFSNESLCVLLLIKEKTRGSEEYFYVFDLSAGQFYEPTRLE